MISCSSPASSRFTFAPAKPIANYPSLAQQQQHKSGTVPASAPAPHAAPGPSKIARPGKSEASAAIAGAAALLGVDLSHARYTLCSRSLSRSSGEAGKARASGNFGPSMSGEQALEGERAQLRSKPAAEL